VDTAAVIVLTGDPNTSSAEAVKLEPFCLACHDADAAGGSDPFSDAVTPVAVDATAWAASTHKATLTCYGDGTFGCHGSGHGSKKIKMLTPYGTAATTPPNTEEEGFCFTCHGSGDTYDVETPFNPATIRWVTAVAGPNSNVNLNDRHDIDDTSQGTSGAKIECTDCHDSHTANSSSPPLSRLKADPDPTDGHVPGTDYYLSTTSDDLSEWCMDCHDNTFPATITAPSTVLTQIGTSAGAFPAGNKHDSHGDEQGKQGDMRVITGWDEKMAAMKCLDCHNTHNSERATKRNLFQLKDTVYYTDGTTPITEGPGGASNYEVTDNSAVAPIVDGYNWCHTCHGGNMSNSNCFRCHYHTTRF
jgi:hypothetical protein